MRARELDWIDPWDAARRLAPLGGLAFLDSALPHPRLGRWAFVAAAPVARVSADLEGAAVDGVRRPGAPLDVLREALAEHARPADTGLPPFSGGAVGYFAYELGHALERLDRPPDLRPEHPLFAFGLYDTVLALDLCERRATLVSADADRATAFRQALAAPPPALPPLPAGGAWRSNFDAASFAAAVERTRDYVLAGDVYQANLAQTFERALPPGFSPLALYGRLRRTNPAPFAAFLELEGGAAVASSSPERFVQVRGGQVETRPIKGTAPRSADPAEDARLGQALLASEKDRAENVMIVDLMRNDLARVCTADSVQVETLCGLETYAGVHHLVSAVTGELAPGRDALDLVAASFPPGSITGAPKLRAMDVITELERTRRGAYCGAIGYLGFDGSLDLNVAIRTLSFEPGVARLGVGGGITVLSDPAAEYRETLTKAERVLAAFEAP